MATAVEPTPIIPPPSYRHDVTAAGVGSLVSPVKLPPAPTVEPQFSLVDLFGKESARPERELSFGALQDPGLRLIKPIPLEVSVEGDDVILTWAAVDEFGCGDNTSAAADDFGQSIRELYHHLHTEDVQLGNDLLRVRGILDQYIASRG